MYSQPIHESRNLKQARPLGHDVDLLRNAPATPPWELSSKNYHMNPGMSISFYIPYSVYAQITSRGLFCKIQSPVAVCDDNDVFIFFGVQHV